jgi:tellurite resistance protein
VLQGSDAVVVSGAPTVPAVKQLVAKLAHLDAISAPTARVAVAVNGCAADLLGRVARRAEVDRALPGRRVFYVRRDSAAVDGALDIGRPLGEVSPNSRVARDIGKIARWAEEAAGAALAPRAAAAR